VRRVARFALALLFPALAIVVAAGAQELLSQYVPAMGSRPLGSMTLGNHVAVILEFVVCAATGYGLLRLAGSTVELIIAGIAPIAWAAALLVGNFPLVRLINWHNPLVWYLICAAVAPVLGVAFGWRIAANARLASSR